MRTINYMEGTQFLSKEASPVPASALTTDGKPGVKASLLPSSSATGYHEPQKEAAGAGDAHGAGRSMSKRSRCRAKWPARDPVLIHWETTLTAPETGDYNLGMEADGFFRMLLDGKEVTTGFQSERRGCKAGTRSPEKGKAYELTVEYGQMQEPKPIAKLMWAKIDLAPQPAAIAAAKEADVVVAVVGITSELEGEEMQVHEAGLQGRRPHEPRLPKPEEDLLEALAATGKPLVVVLTNGSALGVNWANEHANAILDAWYPGEEGGAAVAETLSGRTIQRGVCR